MPVDLATWYNQQLALLIGGKVAEGSTPKLLTQSGSAPPLGALLPRYQAEWLTIIDELLTTLRTADNRLA